MNEMKFKELLNKNQCPAEYVNNHEEGNLPYNCEACGYDCRTCVEEFINDYEQENNLGA